ncbi:hypothetical protein NMG60_11033378 [Bertholletia excelsa]
MKKEKGKRKTANPRLFGSGPMQSAAGTLGTTIAGIPRRRPPFCPSNSSLLHIISPIQSPKFGLSSATVRASQISSLADSDGNNHKRVPNLQNFTVAKLLLNFAITNFLPIALVSGVVLGIAFPSLGCLAHKFGVSKLCTFGIFLISGLKLKGGETKAVSEAFPAVIFGLTSILLLGPFLAKVILQVQLAPQEFVTGLAIFCCVPTTLSSGVALTQLVGGNTALALAVTVVSNLLGILVVPFWISKLVADGFGVSIPIEQMSQHLIFTLLVPLALGKVLQNSSLDLARLVDHNNRTLSMTSIILLSLGAIGRLTTDVDANRRSKDGEEYFEGCESGEHCAIVFRSTYTCRSRREKWSNM